MNKSNIDNAPVGSEIDALIAEHVMGLLVYSNPQDTIGLEEFGFCKFVLRKDVLPYSTEIAAAWEVVKKLRLGVLPFGIDEWCCANGRDKERHLNIIGIAPTAPLAICRAALNLNL